MGMISEFKEFINRGNVIDLAIGVVIGGAFGKVVDSFVKDLLMPLIPVSDTGLRGWMVGKLALGNFVDALVTFLIVAFAVFLVVKAVNAMRKPEPAAAAGPSQEQLLAEIRDLLKARS